MGILAAIDELLQNVRPRTFVALLVVAGWVIGALSALGFQGWYISTFGPGFLKTELDRRGQYEAKVDDLMRWKQAVEAGKDDTRDRLARIEGMLIEQQRRRR